MAAPSGRHIGQRPAFREALRARPATRSSSRASPAAQRALTVANTNFLRSCGRRKLPGPCGRTSSRGQRSVRAFLPPGVFVPGYSPLHSPCQHTQPRLSPQETPLPGEWADYVEIMSGLCQDYVRIMSGLCWDCARIVSGLCWDYVGIMLGFCVRDKKEKHDLNTSGQVDAISPEALSGWMPMT